MNSRFFSSYLLLGLCSSLGVYAETGSYDWGYSETPLMEASLQADIARMKCLITEGEDVNAVESRDFPRGGSPVLRYAIDSHSLKAVRLLLEHGANPNDFTSHAPLLLRDRNPVRNLSMLSYAIRTKAPICVIKELLKYGADVNGHPKLFGDYSALMVAAIVGYKEAAQVLLDHGADRYVVNSYDQHTALDYAKENNHLAIVALL